MNNYILAINIYFSILRPNSHIGSFVDMDKQYKTCIYIICDNFLPNPADKKKKYELKTDIDRQVEKSVQNEKSEAAGTNFDPITIEAEPEEVLINLIASILNLREGISVD